MSTQPRITDLFSLDELQDEIDAGYVKLRQHPTAPLTIANYTAQAQYAHHWNGVTRHTRGLIYNTDTLEIVARPWAKFFNIDQVETPTPPQGAAMIRAPKFDGSLGIVFLDPDQNVLEVATRGSFTSGQAEHATKRLHDTLDEMTMEDELAAVEILQDPNLTVLFEIVYPENRIVVDYGTRDELVLLDVLDNETGNTDFSAFDALPWPSRADKVLVPGGFYDTIFSDIPEGEEGFVLYWPHSGVRAKVKSARYLEIHRLVFGLSEKSIWQQVGEGKNIDEIKDGLPDEFYDFVDTAYHKLRTKQLDRYTQVLAAWNEISGDPGHNLPPMMTRKDFALRAVKYEDLSKYLFKILDGAQTETILKMVWDEIKPVGETHAISQSEDVA